jgi:phosphoglycerate dehydrogenase-like enzyme
MLDETLVPRLERCRLIVRAGVGFDQIAIAACAAWNSVCNTPDYGTTDVADQRCPDPGTGPGHRRLQRRAQGRSQDRVGFRRAADDPAALGRVFGVVGLGRIGTATALRAKALGMQVVFFDPIARPAPSWRWVSRALAASPTCWRLPMS